VAAQHVEPGLSRRSASSTRSFPARGWSWSSTSRPSARS